MIYAFGINYPFINDSGLAGSVKDLYICLPYSYRERLPLRIGRIEKRPNSAAIDLYDKDGNVIYTGDLTATSSNIVDHTLYVHSAGEFVVNILLSDSYLGTATITDGWIDSRAVYVLPNHVTSITVNDSSCYSNVILAQGHNTSLGVSSKDSNTIRPATVITINAEPGAGLGRYATDCEEEATVKSINGVTADENGNVSFTGGECHSVTADNNSLAIRNDCTPCCRCEDFTTAGEYLDQLAHEYYDLGAQADYLKKKIIELIALWESLMQINCEEGCKALVEVHAVTNPDPYGIVLVVVRNITDKDLQFVKLELTVSNDKVKRHLLSKTVVEKTEWSCKPVIHTEAVNSDFWESMPTSSEYTWHLLPRGKSVLMLWEVRYPLATTPPAPTTFTARLTSIIPDVDACYTTVHTTKVTTISDKPTDNVFDPSEDRCILTSTENKIRAMAAEEQGLDCFEEEEPECE